MTAGLTDGDLDRLRTLLAQSAGLVFEDSRRSSLAYSVAERLRATGADSVADYLERVEVAGSTELQDLIDEVTIQETHFFRNPPQVRALRQHVLPELLRAASSRGRRVRIWSAGCSTGDEPYTLAMILRELLPSTAGWDIRIIATDISVGALAVAQAATYGSRAVQLATPGQLARFFTPAGDGRYQVRPEVRELVKFLHHNLVAEPPPSDGLDLVLCRNVTIYFSRETTRALVGRLHTSLRDGGYLFLGHSETLWQLSEDFRLVAFGPGESAAFVYRRLDTTDPALPPERRPELRPGRRTERRTVRPDHRAAQELPEPAAPIRAALAQGQYEDAARLARSAAAVDPLRADLHYLLGRALTELSRDAEALPALRRAVYLSPDSGLAHFLLAGALARDGDRTAAAREYWAAAQTLGRDPAEASAPELGGRSVKELALLCAQLEGQLTRELA